MPVDFHPQEGICSVEVILTRIHADSKFSRKNYQFYGGLYGMSISIVNASSFRLDVTNKRSSKKYFIKFEHS
ncbi:MAG: hypothetical protein HRT91_02945 [Piscirickettsiaceae bacterium]|nr:hypothetical protein [Piscirickettsiaceae bacterium]